MFGTQDLIIVAVIVIVLFGARRLPEIGKGLGQSIRDFKKAVAEPELTETSSKDGAKKEGTQKQEGD